MVILIDGGCPTSVSKLPDGIRAAIPGFTPDEPRRTLLSSVGRQTPGIIQENSQRNSGSIPYPGGTAASFLGIGLVTFFGPIGGRAGTSASIIEHFDTAASFSKQVINLIGVNNEGR